MFTITNSQQFRTLK